MKMLFKLLIPFTLVAMTGCVVAPYGYGYRGYYGRGYYGGPRAAIVVPAPVVVVRP